MANSPRVKTRNILRVKGHQSEKIEDLVVTEEPLEIRLGYGPEKDRKQKRISITMRTPGHDFELSLGFLFGEGIISAYSEVTNINYCPNVERPEEVGNVVKVELRPDLQPDIAKLERNFYMTSSCGVCG
ncbi:MAG TPA: sulfurtransferase FdhD, partial [Bacteroidetes bacterium]|nr:sulfurtransferase FdhD [Bacteroidota bacterium]